MPLTISITETNAILGQVIASARDAQRSLERAATAMTPEETAAILEDLGPRLGLVITPDATAPDPE